MVTKKSEVKITVDSKLTEAERNKLVARYMLSPEVSGAAVMESFSKNFIGDQVSFQDMTTVLKESTKELTENNSMEHVERLLLTQAIVLNNLFTSFARRASNQENLKWYETHMRFALKAQSQSRATLETLATVKNPPVYANTANIATNQQINNGAPPAQPTPQSMKEALTHEQSEPLPSEIKAKQEAKS